MFFFILHIILGIRSYLSFIHFFFYCSLFFSLSLPLGFIIVPSPPSVFTGSSARNGTPGSELALHTATVGASGQTLFNNPLVLQLLVIVVAFLAFFLGKWLT